MITLLKKTHYTKSFWKNGLGTTEQIDIYPTNSSLMENNFLWRMSSASVKAPNDFSQFLGYDRVLLVWNGPGLLLNKHPLKPDAPYYFKGEEVITCELLNNSEVIDLGIIYKRDKLKVLVEILKIDKNQEIQIDIDTQIHYFFLARGANVQLNNIQMELADTIKIESSEKELIKIMSAYEDILIYHFTLVNFSNNIAK